MFTSCYWRFAVLASSDWYQSGGSFSPRALIHPIRGANTHSGGSRISKRTGRRGFGDSLPRLFWPFFLLFKEFGTKGVGVRPLRPPLDSRLTYKLHKFWQIVQMATKSFYRTMCWQAAYTLAYSRGHVTSAAKPLCNIGRKRALWHTCSIFKNPCMQVNYLWATMLVIAEDVIVSSLYKPF